MATRAARGFADGIASVLLASYLSRLGFTPVQIGAIAGVAAGLPDALSPASAGQAERAAFLVYAAFGAFSALAYRKLSPALEPPPATPAPPLQKSRGIVLQLAALFSLDSFGGGFVVQSILALWLFRRFDVPVSQAGAIFFAVNVLGAFSQP